jgi:excisionase family DNA binding protein
VADSVALLTVAEVAGRLGLSAKRVHQLIRDHELAAVRDESGQRCVPADFLLVGPDGGTEIVKGLSGLLTLLADARYTDDEAVGWLFAPDDSLLSTPIEAVRAGRGTEVRRLAQTLGF